MKIIFLDIDGVFNSEDWYVSDDPKRGKGYFDPECVKLFNKIIEKTDAKIVVSSSWRTDINIDVTLKNVGIKGDIIGKTEYFATGVNHLCRGNEIDKWLWDNEDKWDNYCIIDDDADMLLKHIDNFVNTDYKYGLTERDVKKAIKILNG